MENASKALLISGGVLLAILVLTIGILFYNNINNSQDAYIAKLDTAELTKYNAPYEVLEDRKDITAQEILTVVGDSKQKNENIIVEVKDKDGKTLTYNGVNFNEMQKLSQAQLNDFSNENIQEADGENKKLVYYKCSGVYHDDKTGKVTKIVFEQVVSPITVAETPTQPESPTLPEDNPPENNTPEDNPPENNPPIYLSEIVAEDEDEYVTIRYIVDPNKYGPWSGRSDINNIITHCTAHYVHLLDGNESEKTDKVKKNSTVYRREVWVKERDYGWDGIIREGDTCQYYFSLNSWICVQPSGGVSLTLNPGDNANYGGGMFTAKEDTTFLLDIHAGWGKPIIYLYPEEETEINVKLAYPEKLTVSYPKYKKTGWNVIAEPSGKLTDTETKRELYCLYYEANNSIDKDSYKDGFVVKGEDTSKFLEEKLAILGLTEREAEEFIVYWLPRLEENKYNFIRFAESDYINEAMPLEIEPKPDNLIRVLMEYKPLEKPIKVKEQKLTTPAREGYTAVEWGATEIPF